jgi:signal transduction histidine kinase
MKASRSTEIGRTLLYLVSAIPLGALAFAVLVAGWTLTLVLSFTPLVVPALVGHRAAVGWVARAEAALANALLGVSTRPSVTSSGRPGFWWRAGNVVGDRTFWKQQAFLLQRFVLGWALAISELSLVAAGGGAVALPIYYRWSGPQIGAWHVVTFGRALVFVPAAIVALGLALVLVRPFADLSRFLVAGLLGGEPAEELHRPPAVVRRLRLRSLALHATTIGVVNLLFVVIWAVTSRGYFWPEWTLILFGVILAMHAWAVLVDERPDLVRRKRMTRGVVMHAGVSTMIVVFLGLIWAVTTRGYFWPIWAAIALGALFAMHLGVTLARRDQERIEVLETTRAGAVDQQETELRRIERDLHDGAQARLVALGMSLGMAEQKLVSDPEAAKQLLLDARRGAHEALEELRDLARGIHPPVLADRGLAAAVSALADRTPLRVNITVDVGKRPAPPVESAAYFIVAEALANIGKHANAEQVDIVIRRERDELVVEVVDDGGGGADPGGNGLGGLARRVEALDGTFLVTSPAGGPTALRVVMPCGS